MRVSEKRLHAVPKPRKSRDDLNMHSWLGSPEHGDNEDNNNNNNNNNNNKSNNNSNSSIPSEVDIRKNEADLYPKFQLQAEFLSKNNSLKMNDDTKLKLYAYYKYVQKGPCKSTRPSFLDPVGRSKWDAYNGLNDKANYPDMSESVAMESYIKIAEQVKKSNS